MFTQISYRLWGSPIRYYFCFALAINTIPWFSKSHLIVSLVISSALSTEPMSSNVATLIFAKLGISSSKWALLSMLQALPSLAISPPMLLDWVGYHCYLADHAGSSGLKRNINADT